MLSVRVCVCASGFAAAARTGYGRRAAPGRRHWPSNSRSLPSKSLRRKTELAGWRASALLRRASTTHTQPLTTHHLTQTLLELLLLFRLPCSPLAVVLSRSAEEYTTRSRARVVGRACMNTSYPPSPYSPISVQQGRACVPIITALSNACLDSRVSHQSHAWQCSRARTSPHVQ
jgi:hypothetical protein